MAVAGSVGAVISNFAAHQFWSRNPVLAGLLANLIVIALSIAIINEALDRRSRRRWRVLAQYALFDVNKSARLVWTAILDAAALLPAPSAVSAGAALEAGERTVRDTDRLTSRLRGALADREHHAALQEEIGRCAKRSNDALGRWAALMANADPYTEILDRHVELASDVAWLSDALDNYDEPRDLRHRLRARFIASVDLGDYNDQQWLAERIVMVAQLAERLDRATFEVALRLVPAEWWETRLAGPLPFN